MAEIDNNLGDVFSWDNDQVADDFFNDSPEDLARVTEASAVVTEIENDNIETEQVIEKTNEQLADEMFNDEVLDNNEDEDNTEDEQDTGAAADTNKTKVKVEKPTMVNTATILKEKGIIDFELEEGEELTDERADEIIEDGFDTAVDNRLKDIFDGMPDVVKQLVKFTKDGGDPVKFLSNVLQSQTSGLTVNMDLTSESNQEAVMKSVLKDQGYDDDYIDIHIETLKDSNKLEAIAKKQYSAWETKQAKENEDLVASQEQKRIKDKEDMRKEKLKLNTTLSSLDDINGIKLNNKDKKEIPSYMMDKTIKLQNGNTITALQKDVWESLGNETTAIQLAKLMRNRKEDGSFDFSKIEINAKTKVVKEIKNNIQRNKDITTPQRSVSGSSRKELADFF